MKKGAKELWFVPMNQEKAELSTLPALTCIGNASALLPSQTLPLFWLAWWERLGHAAAKGLGTYLGCVPPGKTSLSSLLLQGSTAFLPQVPHWAVSTAFSFWAILASTITSIKQAGRKKTPLLLFCRLPSSRMAACFGGRHLVLYLSPQEHCPQWERWKYPWRCGI